LKIEKPFPQEQIEQISKVLGATSMGLKGSEIGHLLKSCGISDVDPKNTKWKRLYNALVEEQNKKQYGNHIIGFIHHAMKPARYTSSEDTFQWRREHLNMALSFIGLNVGEDGKIRRTERVSNISDAKKKANRLKAELEKRNVHPDVLKFCKAELVVDNYFHSVLEAVKSIAEKIRTKSQLTCDGVKLIQDAFSLGQSETPLLAINGLQTKTEKGEQKAFVNLLIGVFGMFRNPTAHEPKIQWVIDENDALDILTLASMIHRKLDIAYRYNQNT